MTDIYVGMNDARHDFFFSFGRKGTERRPGTVIVSEPRPFLWLPLLE